MRVGQCRCVDSAALKLQLRVPVQAHCLTELFPPNPHFATKIHQTCKHVLFTALDDESTITRFIQSASFTRNQKGTLKTYARRCQRLQTRDVLRRSCNERRDRIPSRSSSGRLSQHKPARKIAKKPRSLPFLTI